MIARSTCSSSCSRPVTPVVTGEKKTNFGLRSSLANVMCLCLLRQEQKIARSFDFRQGGSRGTGDDHSDLLLLLSLRGPRPRTRYRLRGDVTRHPRVLT